MDPIIIFGLVGLVLGLIISTIFGVYSKKSTTSYVRTIFGYSSNSLITDIIVLVLAASLVVLSVVSGFVRDLSYPIKYPWKFTLETFMMALLPASVFLMMIPLRGYTYTTTYIGEFFILLIKFGLLHVLLQFSGFYSEVFPPK